MRVNNAPESTLEIKIFCAATPELVLLHILLTGPPQKRKCFPGISRYPTNPFQWNCNLKEYS